MPVDLLVNNADFGPYGRFDTPAAEREHQEIMLKVTALVDLTHAFVQAMVAKHGDQFFHGAWG